MPECPHKNAFPLCDGTEVLVILLATRSLSADLCAAFYHVCHWNAGLTAPVDTSTLGPQCRHAGVSYQSITFLFHRFKSPVKWGLYLQPANSLSLWSGFILCCRRLAVRGDGSILCSRAESSLGDHHGTHFQPSSSFSALSVCVQHWCHLTQWQYIITVVPNMYCLLDKKIKLFKNLCTIYLVSCWLEYIYWCFKMISAIMRTIIMKRSALVVNTNGTLKHSG